MVFSDLKVEMEKSTSSDYSRKVHDGMSGLEDVCQSSQSATDHVEDDGVTLTEIIDDEEYRQSTARLLLGSQDGAVCTYPEGYKSRQALYSCMTCAPPPNQAGICYGCSIHCHDGHDLVELYTKRKFRCDCGNSVSGGNACTLYEKKETKNADNTYNQNFAGLFCVCHKTYPSDETDEAMLQCCLCEDWFHPSHIGIVEADDDPVDLDGDFDLVCKQCSSTHSFLLNYKLAISTFCLTNDNIQSFDEPFFLPGNWRTKICPCSKCEAIFFQKDCLFLLDKDDDIRLYEKDSIENTKTEREPDENAIVDALVKEGGRDTAITVLKGYNDLKSKLCSFLNSKSEEGVGVITKEHISSFFQQMKRPRLDDNAY